MNNKRRIRLTLTLLQIFGAALLLQPTQSQYGVLDDVTLAELNSEPPEFIPWKELPWTQRMLSSSCNFDMYSDTFVESWWGHYFNGTEVPVKHPLRRLLESGGGATQETSTTLKPPNIPGAGGPVVELTTEIANLHDYSDVEPRIDSRPLREQLNDLCFLEEDDHDYLYACNEDHHCICLTKPVFTVPVNTGVFIRCLVGEENLCVSPKRPDKPYPCHRKFYCDVNNTKTCLPCKNHPNPKSVGCPEYYKRNTGSQFTSNGFGWAFILVWVMVFT